MTGPTRTFAPGDIQFVEATCPAGTKLLGGGYFSNIMTSPPADLRRRADVVVLINNDYGFAIDANAHAICAAP